MNPDTAQLYATLTRLSRQIHRFSHRVEQQQGLFHGRINLLKTIESNDGIVQRDLAELLDMRPSSMTEILGKLESQNLIARQQDAKDQRLTHVLLTEAGRQAMENVAKSEVDFTNLLFRGLSEEEIQSMLAITGKLCDSIDSLIAESPEGSAGEFRHHHHHHCREEE